MTDNSSTQRAMRICRVFTQLHLHGYVWHCYFLDLNHSAAILVIRASRSHCLESLTEKKLRCSVLQHSVTEGWLSQHRLTTNFVE